MSSPGSQQLHFMILHQEEITLERTQNSKACMLINFSIQKPNALCASAFQTQALYPLRALSSSPFTPFPAAISCREPKLTLSQPCPQWAPCHRLRLAWHGTLISLWHPATIQGIVLIFQVFLWKNIHICTTMKRQIKPVHYCSQRHVFLSQMWPVPRSSALLVVGEKLSTRSRGNGKRFWVFLWGMKPNVQLWSSTAASSVL